MTDFIEFTQQTREEHFAQMWARYTLVRSIHCEIIRFLYKRIKNKSFYRPRLLYYAANDATRNKVYRNTSYASSFTRMESCVTQFCSRIEILNIKVVIIMQIDADLISVLKEYGVGRRKIDDVLFIDDKPPLRLGIYDVDEEEHCLAATPIKCTVPGCNFTAESLLQFENHYNASHRYSCSQCKKVSPSPHLLDLHIQEQHDSFFAVMATRKPSYSCYIEECKEKFLNTEERLNHCVNAHKLPKDFRFDYAQKQKIKTKKTQSQSTDTDNCTIKTQKFNFTNSKQKGFKNYTGKKFTKEQDSSASVNMDAIMTDLKDNLP